MSWEEVSSPTVSAEFTPLTATTEACKGRDITACNITNAYIQTEAEEVNSDGIGTIMKIWSAPVNILHKMDPQCQDCVVMEGNQKVLHMHIAKAIHGPLVSTMPFHKKPVKDLKGHGFAMNPQNPCVANKLVNREQLTISWHAADLKSSSMDAKVQDKFIQWIGDTCGSIGEVKVTQGKIHECLGMKLDCLVQGQISMDMVDHIKSMVKGFPTGHLQGKVE